MGLLRELRKSAPDEDLMNQVKVAASLTDTSLPETEALRRMVDYASREAVTRLPIPIVPSSRTNIFSRLNMDDYYKQNFTPVERVEQRIGRKLTDNEIANMGADAFWRERSQEPSDLIAENLRMLNRANAYRNPPLSKDYGKALVGEARTVREEAQRRMALEYLMGGLD
jgi:hypothetical protein